ncbi:hypothetical protein Q73_02205 [Bacillus coahuilensis m2-6]|uniref:helix-turn-helix transcriptional regulator n=2 Tax=Bacillus coahuilensis TaxID=408580 RepID=UPI0007505785|nr:helix-turn-helix transcriptional regulator [Bacillus coahuilensis]KUP09623.1 hypothetical protein Q73_02205 [Bacillus coahuilensis m2-6]
MDDRLKGLKKAMDTHTFRHVPFTEEKKARMKRGMERAEENDLFVQGHILQLLLAERTGHELIQLLRARGLKRFLEEEGFLYATLHQYEKDRWIESIWRYGVKSYRMTSTGRKLLEKQLKKKKRVFSLKEILEGGFHE